MILYIHGFRTTTASYKATLLKNYYKDDIYIANFSYEPKKAIENLEKILSTNSIRGIIASSLGGYYATYLCEEHNLKGVLINPSVKPFETTKKYLGEVKRQDSTKFIWKEQHLRELKELYKKNISYEKYFVFLQKGDEVLDYKVALERYKKSKIVLEDGGNHRFHRFERYFKDVSEFLAYY